MTGAIVRISNDFGGESLYRRLSARLPAFLEKYPIQNGEYRLDSEYTDSLSLQTGRLALLREVIASGRSFQDLGFSVPESTWMVCTRILLDREGKLVAKASASSQIVEYKDYEMLETAATQRLLAALGFGGEVFDVDEDKDLATQRLTHNVAQVASSGSLDSASSKGGSDLSSGGEQRETPSTQSSASERAPLATGLRTPSDENKSQHSGAATPIGESSSTVPAALAKQVANLANRLGEPVSILNTRDEAQAELSRLSRVQRNRRQELKTGTA